MKSHSLSKLGSEELVAKLREVGRTKTYGVGEEIFRAGDKAEFLPIVLEGRLKVVRFLELGKEIILNMFSEGEMFAIPPILDGRSYPATAVAIDETRLLLIYKNDFDELLESSPEFSSAVMSKMSALMRDITASMENLATASSEQRIGKVLLKLAKKETESGAVKIMIRRQDIAEMTGLTTETTIREVRKLADKDLITIVRGKIVIENIEVLQKFLDS